MDSDTVPSNFRSMVKDFVVDLSATFPEYSYLWSKWSDPDVSEYELKKLFEYCLTVYPERFFDILYQNDDIFKPEDETNTYFLPNVSFRLLFNCEDVTETTKKTMWKYLQLMLFTIVGSVKDKSNFGETMNMFEGIDENELQEKMQETMGSIADFFKNIQGEGEGGETGEGENSSEPKANDFQEGFRNMFENKEGAMPDIGNIQDHLKSLFEGKIGKLAKEMAEEIAGDFSDIIGDDGNDIKSTGDVMKKLMKNPKKIMDLMKTVGSKLDAKMKSGEVSRDEIMKEAGDLLGKMKGMGDQSQFQEMFKNMAKTMGGLGKNMRFDENAFDRMTKAEAQKDRMRKNVELKRQQQAEAIEKLKREKQEQFEKQQKVLANYSLQSTNAPNSFVFRLDGEAAQEKSFIHPDLLAEMDAADQKKKDGNSEAAKKKKKKNKK